MFHVIPPASYGTSRRCDQWYTSSWLSAGRCQIAKHFEWRFVGLLTIFWRGEEVEQIGPVGGRLPLMRRPRGGIHQQ